MKNYPKHIKSTLHSVMRDMAKHPEDFCYCPEKDFTRLSGYSNPLTCHAQIAEKVHPSPDARILFLVPPYR